MSKFVNLVVFIDGTGNNAFKQSEEQQTNVARLWHACKEVPLSPEVAQQRIKYEPGVGTRRWELIRGNAVGKKLMDRVQEALSYLKNEIQIAKEDGLEPRIYLFGFSRGAYAVRWLADMLEYDIEVLGCWDTVKATMVGPNVDVARKNVKHAFHAMAVDEHRKLFDVTRFVDSSQAIEVWFPGCHSDVGGGYKEADLALASLNWMVRCAVKYGLLVDEKKIPDEPAYDVMPVVHDETKKLGWRIVGACTFDTYYERVVGRFDTVYSNVAQLRAHGYAPGYLPSTCIAWNDSSTNSNMV